VSTAAPTTAGHSCLSYAALSRRRLRHSVLRGSSISFTTSSRRVLQQL